MYVDVSVGEGVGVSENYTRPDQRLLSCVPTPLQSMLSNPYDALTRIRVHTYVVIRYLGDKFHLPNNYYMYVMFSDWYRIDLPQERFPPPFINFPKHVYPSPSYTIYNKCI